MIIGLMGEAGVGKDTVGRMLQEKWGFSLTSLALPMKLFVVQVFAFPIQHVFGDSEYREVPSPEWDGLTPRRALQTLGTEWGRGLHKDVWVRYALRTAAERGGHVAITDVRFRNELEAIQKAGGKVIRIHRPVQKEGLDSTHLSELEQKGIPDFAVDAVIHNTSGLEELAHAVDQIMSKWTLP